MLNENPILSAWKYAAKRFVVYFLCGYAAGNVLIYVFDVKAQALLSASTVGIRHAAVPAARGAAAAGIDPAFIVFLFNSVAASMFFLLALTARLFDPQKQSEFPTILRKLLISDPTIRMLAPFKGYRAIADTALRPLFACLFIGPMTGVLALGLLIGILLAASSLIIPGPHAVAAALAYLVPHGVFEVAGLLLASAVPISIYFAARPELEGGSSKAVFDLVRAGTAGKTLIRPMATVAGLLLTAAFVETHATAKLAAWLGRAIA